MWRDGLEMDFSRDCREYPAGILTKVEVPTQQLDHGDVEWLQVQDLRKADIQELLRSFRKMRLELAKNNMQEQGHSTAQSKMDAQKS